MTSEDVIENGWEQIKAGLALVTLSKLSSWDAQTLKLVPEKEDNFESACRSIHPDFGRLICWIAFGVGGEYLSRGAFMLMRKCDPTKPIYVIQPPEQGDDIEVWVQRVNKKDPSVRKAEFESAMKFGDLPWKEILSSQPDRDFVSASMKLLAGKIRNRDAHRYAKSVRAFHFHVVKSLFVPAFNILLALVDQAELRSRLDGC
ncbi:MAG: hypothetical protein WA005_01735 [Candidatus Binataceae bacterium]